MIEKYFPENVTRINAPPIPNGDSPYIQIDWIFFQVAAEKSERTAKSYVHARNKFIAYIDNKKQTKKHIYVLSKEWTSSALIEFSDWLKSTELASNTKYAVYKQVRAVMDIAYVLDVIDKQVIHPPMPPGIRETDQRTSYIDSQQEMIGAALAKDLRYAQRVAAGYTKKNVGKPIPIIKEKILQSKEREKNKVTPKNGEPIPTVINGQQYSSKTKAAKAYGIDRDKFKYRIQVGCTPEEAVMSDADFAIRRTNNSLKNEDNLIWLFENIYNCDALQASKDYKFRDSAAAHHKGLDAIFKKWGVARKIDADLILPIAGQLCSLTGLNVESLLSLKIDAYKDRHPLTNQPYLSYEKSRSGNSSRSEEKELHLTLLDDNTLFLNQKISGKVKKLIGLVLTLTEPLRKDKQVTSDIANTLFIFEHRHSNPNWGINIIGINAQYLGSWYSSFIKRHNLYDKNNKPLIFNFSRFRPTFATNMIMNGADFFALNTALGHSNLMTTLKYIDSHRIEPKFNKAMNTALEGIKQRSYESKTNPLPVSVTNDSQPGNFVFETLSGCFCKNPYDPSEHIKKRTNHMNGSICKYWNMCLFCENSLITEGSLPKLFSYRARIEIALSAGIDDIPGKGAILRSTKNLLNEILAPDAIFPKDVLDNANEVSENEDDILIDQLVFQGV